MLWLGIHSVNASQTVSLPDSILKNLQPGDILIRKGGGPLSYQLMEISHENYSHCGVVVKQNGRWMVIESIAASQNHLTDGVQINPLENFLRLAVDSSLFICRAIIDITKNEMIASRAFYYLSKKIPFDHRFNIVDTNQFYCSELLLHIFRDVFKQNVFEIRQQHNTFVPLFSTFFDPHKFLPVYWLKKEISATKRD